MMDSVDLEANVRLDRMIDIMLKNALDHAAPTFPNFYRQYPVMSSHKIVPGTVGRRVEFIEMHMDIFSRKYFECVQNIANNDKTGFGWGLDLVLPHLCPGRLGLIDEMRMNKTFKGAYNYYDAGKGYEKFMDSVKEKFPGTHLVDPWRDSTFSYLNDPMSLPPLMRMWPPHFSREE